MPYFKRKSLLFFPVLSRVGMPEQGLPSSSLLDNDLRSILFYVDESFLNQKRMRKRSMQYSVSVGPTSLHVINN
ncbi:hypothetical protein BLOT_004242, partial [Blomia tropicalis]